MLAKCTWSCPTSDDKRLFTIGHSTRTIAEFAKIEESEEEEIELEPGDEIAPEEGATVGESELEKPADPEPEK